MMLFLHGTRIRLTTHNLVCGVGRIENMVISAVLFIGFVLATGAVVVKAYEWLQDVLYGPYLKPLD